MEKPLVYVTFDYNYNKYYIGYTKNTKDKIHNPVHNNRTYKGSGMDDEGTKFVDLPDERWDELETQVIAYFDDHTDAHIAESQLQKYMDCAGDFNSYNRSNAVNVPSKNIFTKIVKKISSTWFGLGQTQEKEVTNDNSFKEDELKAISDYIKSFDYIQPCIPFNTINKIKSDEDYLKEPSEITQTPDMIPFNTFLDSAVREVRLDGEAKGYNNPTQTGLDDEYNSLTIKLNSQIDARLFDLEREVVGIETKCELFVNNIGKVMDLKILLKEKQFEIEKLKDTNERKKWADMISNAFLEGFKLGAEKRLSEL